MTHVLLLAGTGEARAVARALRESGGFDVIASFAGATSAPADMAVRTRSGGFGGADGLTRFVQAERIDLLIDATHPFAAQMKANAAAQAIPVCHIIRPAWRPVAGDHWINCASLQDAVRQLPAQARAFLALGQRHLSAFEGHPAELWVRSVEASNTGTAMNWIIGSPGSAEDEAALFTEHDFTHLVCRNSGGNAGYGKIEAARQLGLPVLMVQRPAQPVGTIVETAEAALRWCKSMSEQDGG